MAEITIIIPVYNAEAYLQRCLDSLIRQTYEGWKALCIDDGSSDGSSEILDRYAATDDRITVIHKANEGVAQARNDAILKVDTEYTAYMDSDDFLHPQTFEISLYMAKRDRSDLVAYTINRTYRTRMIIRHLFTLPDPRNINFEKYLIEKTASKTTDDIFEWATEYSHSGRGEDEKWMVKHCQAYRCLYRTSVIKNIKFFNTSIYEDFPWWSEVLLSIKKATIINLPLYFYYPSKTSCVLHLAQSSRIESLKKVIEASENLYKERADKHQREKWENNFLRPFKEKLAKKERICKKNTH